MPDMSKELTPEQEKQQAQRQRALDAAMLQIQKDFGENAIMRLGDQKKMEVEVIPTGNLLIDRALGVGGFPRGRIVEVFGPESSGKTTLTLTVIAQAQKSGGLAAFIDVEHALDPSYAAKLGVNLDDLLVSQPGSGEEALQICEALVRSNAIDVIVVDSVAALVTRQELEGEIGDSTVGAQARLMSAALRKLTSLIAKARTICIFTNHSRLSKTRWLRPSPSASLILCTTRVSPRSAVSLIWRWSSTSSRSAVRGSATTALSSLRAAMPPRMPCATTRSSTPRSRTRCA